MSKHDLKCKELQVNKIINKQADSIIEVDNVLRQTETFDYDDFDLVPLWKVNQMLAISSGASKTTLNVNAGFDIDWQNGLVPGDPFNRNYAEKHGNSIANIQGHQNVDGTMTPYSPEYTYTLNGDGTINILTLTTVFAGTITII